MRRSGISAGISRGLSRAITQIPPVLHLSPPRPYLAWIRRPNAEGATWSESDLWDDGAPWGSFVFPLSIYDQVDTSIRPYLFGDQDTPIELNETMLLVIPGIDAVGSMLRYSRVRGVVLRTEEQAALIVEGKERADWRYMYGKKFEVYSVNGEPYSVNGLPYYVKVN